METEGRKYELFPGRIFLLNNQTRYVSTHEKNKPLEVQAIHFNYEQERTPPPFFTAILQDTNFVKTIYKRIHHYFGNRDRETAGFWIETLINEVIYTREKLIKIDYQEERIDKISKLILENPAKRWTVNEIAQRFNLSPNHLTRLFSRIKGISPMAYAIQCRLDMAKSFLLSTSYPINQISELCGYTDIYFFSRQFKQNVGVPPVKFRIEGER